MLDVLIDGGWVTGAGRLGELTRDVRELRAIRLADAVRTLSRLPAPHVGLLRTGA